MMSPWAGCSLVVCPIHRGCIAMSGRRDKAVRSGSIFTTLQMPMTCGKTALKKQDQQEKTPTMTVGVLCLPC